MSQITPAIVGLTLFVGGMGASQYLNKRWIEGRWSNTTKPDTLRYGLLMRDLAVSDNISDQRVEKTTSESKLALRKEYEEELNHLYLEVFLKQKK